MAFGGISNTRFFSKEVYSRFRAQSATWHPWQWIGRARPCSPARLDSRHRSACDQCCISYSRDPQKQASYGRLNLESVGSTQRSTRGRVQRVPQHYQWWALCEACVRSFWPELHRHHCEQLPNLLLCRHGCGPVQPRKRLFERGQCCDSVMLALNPGCLPHAASWLHERGYNPIVDPRM